MKQFKLTGGARIGRANATYPFAELYVDENTLKINASLVGNLIFQPQDIISIKPYSSLPIIGQGVKILHRVENYNQNVIFWTMKDPGFVINEIQQTGFLEKIHSPLSEKDFNIIEQQRQGGFPLKPFLPIAFIILWNGLFLYDFVPFFTGKGNAGKPFGAGVCTALGLLFATALLTLISENFRKLILKQGRSLEDVKKFAVFILFLSGVMFATFLTFALS
ncbi:hypothetical protein QFZ37_003661 [Chryseobacterium ginsenosidimutans]|uniref:hypothetical protein n=1 Tax=Chryseobacterium ginsenosidimutans TaxID=687846 RepID=UPI0027885888|nr:hypothetical protein [Chryseobacterium ginsenosidimutans]MDQ0595292.1 hypothetical protein [Chryseobacterium ginsenosidimutans]